MTSLAGKYYQIFLSQGLAFGIGAGGVFCASFVCVGQWFVKRRGLAIGIASCGSSIGGVLFPIFLDRMVKNVGFYGAVRYTALFVGVILAASCFLVRARLPRKTWNRETPWLDVTLFKQKQFAVYTLGSFFVMSVINIASLRRIVSFLTLYRWGLWGPFDFISTMAQARGFSPTLSLYLISIIKYDEPATSSLSILIH
jgi:MFS family permease